MKRYILITGGTSGIGEATVKKFAFNGDFVFFTGRNIEKGAFLEKELCNVKFIKCNHANKDEIYNVFETIKKTTNKLDVLFNNCGFFLSKPLEDTSIEEWDYALNINLKSAVICTTLSIPLMLNGGSIINNASIAGMQSYVSGNTYTYSASKAALIQFTRQCALNYGNKIRFNAICPGVIDTPLLFDRDLSKYLHSIPCGKIGKPEDVANFIFYLASNEANYLNGAIIPVDGGASL